MPLILSKTDANQAIKFLRGMRESVTLARNISQSGFAFNLMNIARDEKASDPASRIYYYQAVDEGRVAITALENQINRFPALHFKVSSTEWVITKSVRASTPRRITDRAMSEVRANLSNFIAEAFGERIPDGSAFIRALKAVEQGMIERFKQATIESTLESNTKLEFYDIESIPLAEGFVIREG